MEHGETERQNGRTPVPNTLLTEDKVDVNANEMRFSRRPRHWIHRSFAHACACVVVIGIIAGGCLAKSDVQPPSKLVRATDNDNLSRFSVHSSHGQTHRIFAHDVYLRRMNHNEHTGQNHASSKSNTDYNKNKKTVYDTSSLLDVWLCLTVAFAWLTVMVSSIMPNELEQYSQNAAIVVGHVLDVELNPFALGSSAAPAYVVTIDYMFESQTLSGNPLQIRKRFQTDIKLQQGFANIELIVLPDDPLSGVIKQEWENEYREFKKDKVSDSGKCCSPPFSFNFWFGAFVLILSIVGAIIKIHTLPLVQRSWGWISLVIGVTMLWPAAIGALEWGKNLKKLSESSSSAFIVNTPKDAGADYAGGKGERRNLRIVSLDQSHSNSSLDVEIKPAPLLESPNTTETRKMSNVKATTSQNNVTTEKKKAQNQKENGALQSEQQFADRYTTTNLASYYVETISRSPTGSSSISSLSCIEFRRNETPDDRTKASKFFSFHPQACNSSRS